MKGVIIRIAGRMSGCGYLLASRSLASWCDRRAGGRSASRACAGCSSASSAAAPASRATRSRPPQPAPPAHAASRRTRRSTCNPLSYKSLNRFAVNQRFRKSDVSSRWRSLSTTPHVYNKYFFNCFDYPLKYRSAKLMRLWATTVNKIINGVISKSSEH